MLWLDFLRQCEEICLGFDIKIQFQQLSWLLRLPASNSALTFAQKVMRYYMLRRFVLLIVIFFEKKHDMSFTSHSRGQYAHVSFGDWL